MWHMSTLVIVTVGTLTKSLGTVAGVCSVLLWLEVLYAAFAVVPRETHLWTVSINACVCPTLAVTEMLVNVLNIDSEDDDDEPSVAEGWG